MTADYGPPRPRRPLNLGWLLVAAAVFAVFELTANPSLAVVVGCLKFGWDDWMAARWIRRRHPNRVNGKVLSHWLLAFGAWKVSAAAFFTIFGLLLGQSVLRRGPLLHAGPMPEGLETASLVWLSGCMLSGLVSVVATVGAARHGVLVWVGRHRNWTELILWTSGIFVLVTTAGIVSICVMMMINSFVPGAGQPDRPVIRLLQSAAPSLLFVFVFIAPAIAFLALKDRLEERVIASSSIECWNVAWQVEGRRTVHNDPHMATVDDFGPHG